MRKNLTDRFFAKVNKTDTCWEWTAYTLYNGYGRFSFNSRTEYAHRVSWFIAHGKWPNKHVMHTCDNPACVNPEHLILGNQIENIKDRNKKQRQYSNQKPHCRHGHEFVLVENGHRIAPTCKPCEVQREYARKAGEETRERRRQRDKKKYQERKKAAQRTQS